MNEANWQPRRIPQPERLQTLEERKKELLNLIAFFEHIPENEEYIKIKAESKEEGADIATLQERFDKLLLDENVILFDRLLSRLHQVENGEMA